MKIKETRHTAKPDFRKLNGRTVVILQPAEYERLREKADEWEPPMPEPDDEGNFPAVAALRVSLARKILRDRRELGLSQVELARRAGIRLDTLKRIEHARYSPSPATVEKIDRALCKARQKMN
jgi:ribosome-binding protein aMBF1 (putative translation factor)